MIQKTFLSLFSLLDPIAEKKNCLFLIKVWIPPTIISASAPGWLGALSPESAREAQRWRGGGGVSLIFRNSFELHKEVHLTFL